MYSSYETTTEMMPLLNYLGALFQLMGVLILIPSILVLISQWKIYKKAGKKGWECLIPIYNIIVLLQIVELPMWYLALFFVPFANIYAMFKIYIELAHKFGKSTGFGVLTIFFNFICFPILAFSKNCTYKGTNSTINNEENNNINQNIQNETNNNNQNNIEPQPITFNQNINTEIKPINSLGFEPLVNNLQPELNTTEPVQIEPQPIENNPMNNQMVEPMSLNNQQQVQGLNVIPGMQNTPPIENNTMNNLVNTETPLQPTTNLGTNNLQPELNVIPGMTNPVQEQPAVIQPQQVTEPNLMNNSQNTGQVTFNNQPPVEQPVQGLNVIPTMNPTPTTAETNQNVGNNQNM